MIDLATRQKLNANPASNPAGDERSSRDPKVRAAAAKQRVANKNAWMQLAEEAAAAGQFEIAEARRAQAVAI